ncbi:hypothetical protein F5888DRAFT_1058375 [Russula emetica]|nr:hypothetical protein F5888DRAFT_1058375 [Russula emetica]
MSTSTSSLLPEFPTIIKYYPSFLPSSYHFRVGITSRPRVTRHYLVWATRYCLIIIQHFHLELFPTPFEPSSSPRLFDINSFFSVPSHHFTIVLISSTSSTSPRRSPGEINANPGLRGTCLVLSRLFKVIQTPSRPGRSPGEQFIKTPSRPGRSPGEHIQFFLLGWSPAHSAFHHHIHPSLCHTTLIHHFFSTSIPPTHCLRPLTFNIALPFASTDIKALVYVPHVVREEECPRRCVLHVPREEEQEE